MWGTASPDTVTMPTEFHISPWQQYMQSPELEIIR